MADQGETPTSFERRRWHRWGIRLLKWVAAAAAGALVGAVATDAYSSFKSSVVGVAAGTSATDASGQPISLEVSPTLRQKAHHGFLFIGHADHCVVYKVTLANNSSSDARRISIQFNSKAG